jgi:hypothetical protein
MKKSKFEQVRVKLIRTLGNQPGSFTRKVNGLSKDARNFLKRLDNFERQSRKARLMCD